MALTNYQMEYNGLVFGQGTDINVEVISGFEAFDMTVGDLSIPRRWGDVPGLHVAQSRDILLELYAVDEDVWRTILDTFLPSDTPTPLKLREPGDSNARFANVRVTGRTFTRNPVHKFKKMVTIRLRQSDPRIYGDSHARSLGIYDAAGGGLDYDILEYGKEYTVDSSAAAVVTNEGNSDAYPVIVLFGPTGGTFTGATLTNLSNGSVADFAFTSPLVSGETLTADMRRIVTVDPGPTPFVSQGGVNRYGDWQLPRTPFALAPGDNELRFEADGTTTDASASVTWLDTSL